MTKNKLALKLAPLLPAEKYAVDPALGEGLGKYMASLRPKEKKTGKIAIHTLPSDKRLYVDDANELRTFSTEIEHILEKNPNISKSLKQCLDRLKDMQCNIEALRDSEDDMEFRYSLKEYELNSKKLLFEMLDEMIKETKNEMKN